MMVDKLSRRCLIGEQRTRILDSNSGVPTLLGAKALIALISSAGSEGFSPIQCRDQLQLVRRDSLFNLSKIINGTELSLVPFPFADQI